MAAPRPLLRWWSGPRPPATCRAAHSAKGCRRRGPLTVNSCVGDDREGLSGPGPDSAAPDAQVVAPGSEWEVDVRQLRSRAATRRKRHKKLLARLRKLPAGEVDSAFQELHEEAFAHVDCLTCANCCATTSPRILRKDVDRLAAALRMKPATFEERFLRVDEDGDLVLRETPCPFLGEDNFCAVYEARPQACRQYPHTDDRRMHRHLDITARNAAICPAVFGILERLAERH